MFRPRSSGWKRSASPVLEPGDELRPEAEDQDHRDDGDDHDDPTVAEEVEAPDSDQHRAILRSRRGVPGAFAQSITYQSKRCRGWWRRWQPPVSPTSTQAQWRGRMPASRKRTVDRLMNRHEIRSLPST